MQLNTLPETPAQAMPALETTEGKQEDMLARSDPKVQAAAQSDSLFDATRYTHRCRELLVTHRPTTLCLLLSFSNPSLAYLGFGMCGQ